MSKKFPFYIAYKGPDRRGGRWSWLFTSEGDLVMSLTPSRVPRRARCRDGAVVWVRRAIASPMSGVTYSIVPTVAPSELEELSSLPSADVPPLPTPNHAVKCRQNAVGTATVLSLCILLTPSVFFVCSYLFCAEPQSFKCTQAVAGSRALESFLLLRHVCTCIHCSCSARVVVWTVYHNIEVIAANAARQRICALHFAA